MADRVLKDIFIAPPISVLDVKQKYWKDRKKYWLSLGIQSELGRSDNLLGLSELLKSKHKSTSIFDPVLTECMYHWFTKKDDVIYDPFAGGSVRGIVASQSGRIYHGCDIRSEQVEHNHNQAIEICHDNMPIWECKDSVNYTPNIQSDFVFTCPPYYDLEKYSDSNDDLSNMSKNEFEGALGMAITRALSTLKDDRFAAIVIGDVRHDGVYNNFYGKTVDMFQKNGCVFYNDMVLLQEPATAAMRSFNYMNSSRKIAKCHQNVLVFVKGNPKNASTRLPKFFNILDL